MSYNNFEENKKKFMETLEYLINTDFLKNIHLLVDLQTVEFLRYLNKK